LDANIGAKLGLEKNLVGVRNTRKIGKANMLHNDYCPDVKVDPETFNVYVDGELATCEPAAEVPLSQRYMLR